MKRWLVFNKENTFFGFIPTKEMLKLFKEQRNMDEFRIEKVTDSDPLWPAVEAMDEMQEASIYHEHIVFSGELDWIESTAITLEGELPHFIGELLIKYIPFIRLSEDEMLVIRALLAHMFQMIKAYEEVMEQDDYIDESFELLDFEFITHSCLIHFGGKE